MTRERVAHLGIVEAVADRALDLGDERLEEAVRVDEHERPLVEAELAEREHLGELLERAEAARQRDERVGALLERALARAHVADLVEAVQAAVVHVHADERVEDHALDHAAGRERGVGGRAHQAGAAAAVQHHVASRARSRRPARRAAS